MTKTEEVEGVAGERGIPSVNRSRSMQSRLNSVLAIGLMAVLGIGMLSWYYTRALERPAQSRQRAQSEAASRAKGEMVLPSLGRIRQPGAPSSQVLIGETPTLPARERARWGSPDHDREPGTPNVPSRGADRRGTPGKDPLERKLSGAVYQDNAKNQPATAPVAPSAAASSAQGGVTLTQARLLPPRHFLLGKGTFIDCTLETAIDATLPGFTTCITATDTFSNDGEMVLLERGSKLLGETQGQIQQGAARLFVLWSEARTPTGVVVPLESPGTDELGRSGLAGQIQRHFWDRFGAAILVTIIDGAVQAATQQASKGNSVIVSSGSSRDIGTEVFRSRLNIPPTLVKPQGDRIQVLVARDVDFRSVYELRAAAAVR